MTPRPIAVVNQATVPLGINLNDLIAVSQAYVDKFLTPTWGVTCKLYVAKEVPANAWSMVLMDNADVQDALGYHDTSPNGQPFSRTFVKTLFADGQSVPVTFTHELGEMLIDPMTNTLKIDNATGDVWPFEIADAVEEDTFKIGGVDVSDFVLPAWFNSGAKGPYDFMGLLTTPFLLRPGGYGNLIRGGQWQDVFGSKEKQERFAKEDRRGHRSEYRFQLTQSLLGQ